KSVICSIILCGIFAGFSFAQTTDSKQPVDYVDPFIGTSTSRWMLYPGPSMPFGMVKLSPDNQEQQWKAGYEYTIENIAGFSQIHSWTMGGLLMMPTTGKLQIKPGTEKDPDAGYRSRFRHETEKASPGYYSVMLDDSGIRAELTSTTRTGFQRYTFPEADSALILVDLKIPTKSGYELTWASIRKVSDTEIVGFSKQQTIGDFWSLNNKYTIYFVIKFDQPFESWGGWNGEHIFTNDYEVHGRGDTGAFFNFATEEGETIDRKSVVHGK